MSRPRTAHDIADALHLIAAQIGALPNPHQPIGGDYRPTVTVQIQPDTAAEVDAFSQALYGQPGHPQQMSGGTWHHQSPRAHSTNVDVGVFCAVENPVVARMRAERDAALAELEAMRALPADAAEEYQGPEHYRAAERQMQFAGEFWDDGREDQGDRRIQLAQVHATLALAAAVAGLDAIEGPGGSSATGRIARDGDAWLAVVDPASVGGDTG